MQKESLKGAGFKLNFYEIESGDEFWISGSRKDQKDRLYGGNRNIRQPAIFQKLVDMAMKHVKILVESCLVMKCLSIKGKLR